jgi:hypothetical protein
MQMNKATLCLSAALSIAAVPLAHAQGPALESNVAEIALVALDTLPEAPADKGDAEFCGHLAAESVSAGARLAESRGWIVTAEAEVGGYDVVSFVRGFVSGTSGSCERLDGNVGIFRAGELVALAYAHDTANGTIGSLEPLEGDAVRLWDGDYLPYPIADLRIEGDAIEITALATVDTVCGAAELPNIHGMPIGEARELLRSHGWSPAEGGRIEEFDIRAADLRDQGITEVEGCSGTGFGYCSYAYEGSAGKLSVSTAGDAEPTPNVSGYTVTCGG